MTTLKATFHSVEDAVADATQTYAPESGHLVATDGGHAAFVPAPLPPRLTYSDEFVLALSRADAALSELSGFAGGLRDPQLIVAPFLRQEAILSSRIEGTPTSLAELLLDEVAAEPDPSARESLREVRNYVAALQYGVERLKEVPLSPDLVRELHERLLRGAREAAWTPGEFRTTQSWVGPPGSTIETAVFVPPPVPEMHAALAEWGRFLRETDTVPDLVQCAMIHQQFEAIHPFLRGNGRIGRLLITLFLVERRRLSHPLLYLSAYFEAHRAEYYDLLQRVRTQGEWMPWLHFFVTGVRETAERAVEQARTLTRMRRGYRAHTKGHAYRLVDELFRTPYVTVPEAQRALGVSNPTARKAVRELEAVGLLEELTKKRWPRAYLARPILDAIQEPLEGLRRKSEAAPKRSPLKSATDRAEPEPTKGELMMDEALRIVDAARQAGVQVRLIGGLAVRRHCRDIGFMDREHSDIDLIGLSEQSRQLHDVFLALGYAENRYVTQATSANQLQYVKLEASLESRTHVGKRPHQVAPVRSASLVDHVDIFMDVMRMDHDLDVHERLDIDEYAISPADTLIAKLQIGKINEKDVHDVIAMLKDLPLHEADDDVSIDVPYLAEVCARDWGLYHDFTTNIGIVLQMIDDYDLTEEEMARAYGSLTAIREALEEERKSLRWLLRARVGQRMPWRREIEDQGGGEAQVIAPEWDWRRDLG